MNPKEINYIEELTKTVQALSLTIESIESDLKKVKNTLSTLSTLKDNIGNIDAIIENSKQSI
jgi:prefoldin subunit 5